MTKLFVPYAGETPASLEINGHRVLIISSEPDEIAAELDVVGADEVREVDYDETVYNDAEFLSRLAANIKGGVVLTPPGISPSLMIRNLKAELPWIH